MGTRSPLSSQLQVPGVAGVQGRVQESLASWYPEFSSGRVRAVLVQTKDFRWSRHFVFEIVRDGENQAIFLLVKCIRATDSTGRVQEAARPDNNAQVLEYEALQTLYNNFGMRESTDLTAARPLALWRDIDALVLEYVSGRDLLAIIFDAIKPWSGVAVQRRALEATRRGGRLVASFHSITRGSYPSSVEFNAEDYAQRLQERTAALVEYIHVPGVRRRLFKTQGAVGKIAERIQEDVQISFLHRDLNPDNIVETPDGRVFTVDTTLHEIGAIEEDLAKFLVHLDTLKKRLLMGPFAIRASRTAEIKGAFLSGYASVGCYSPRVLAMFKLLAFVQRWIDRMSRFTHTVSGPAAVAFQRFRINPFMLGCLDNIWKEIQQECGVSRIVEKGVRDD